MPLNAQTGYPAICWDGVTRRMYVDSLNNWGSGGRHQFVDVDGVRVLVYTRMFDGVLYAISADAAYERHWAWVAERASGFAAGEPWVGTGRSD